MKKILITGKNSYVGKNIKKWLDRFPEQYSTETISLRNEDWKVADFSSLDVIIHVAGIAHIKESNENTKLYYKVNRDLSFEVAKKAKLDGVKQFIFISSMSVFGIETGHIDAQTLPNPKNHYGKSKLQAEELIMNLENDSFKVAIVRPPMIYGKNCVGNYSRLSKLAVKTPIFPLVENSRSMIYIDNLSEFIKSLINDLNSGYYHPQNQEYVRTSEMVKLIGESHEKNIRLTKLFNPFIYFTLGKISLVTKIFGDLVYDQKLSEYVNVV